MATTSIIAGNVRKEIGEYGFDSLAELEAIFVGELGKIDPQSETLFRISCTTTCGNFSKGVGYIVRLFRGASMTYGCGFCQSVGGTAFILIGKASNTWTYYKVH